MSRYRKVALLLVMFGIGGLGWAFYAPPAQCLGPNCDGWECGKLGQTCGNACYCAKNNMCFPNR